MSTARTLITEYLSGLESLDGSIDRIVDLADDGVFEFPYEGSEQVRSVLGLIASHFPRFTVSNVDIHELADGTGLFIEYHVDAVVAGSGKPYAQDYASRLVVDGGKIKLLREYLNVISTARVLLPNRLVDVPAAAI
jgi:ketosteroid isomerase-like protein